MKVIRGGGRRFTLLDVMILVASTALGLAGAREFYPTSMQPPPTGRLAWAFEGPSTVVVGSCSLALLAIRAIPPRPRWRRIVRQPGWVACASALVSIGLGAVSRAAFNAVHSEPMEGLWAISSLWTEAVRLVPAFVCGAWLGLWWSGRWAAEPGWIDRAGRLLGAFWLASLARELLGPALSYYLPKL